MATILDDDDTVEAQSLSTSLDPYGQLIKMIMPRALCIAIYDRMSMPLWLSDGCDGPDLLQLVEEALNSARAGEPDPEEREGFARSWDGDTAYVFILRDGALLLGAVAISSRDSSSGSRPFSLMLGLLRPALQVLGRELSNQCNIGDLQKDLTSRDDDFALLLNASGAADEIDSDDFNRLLHSCVKHLDCSLGVLLIPDHKISISYSANGTDRHSDPAAQDGVQRHLLAWAQVQRRTLTLNKAPPGGPLGAVPYKILACPIQQGAQPVIGILALFKPAAATDFDMRQVRIVEMMARRIAYVLQNAYAATGLLTHPALELRALATLAAGTPASRHCVAYGDVDRLHVVNENHGMHVGDELLERIAEAIRTNLPEGVLGSHICGDRFALFFPGAALEDARQCLAELGRKIAGVDYNYDGERFEPTMSFGVAEIPDTKFPLSHALAAAEAACKAAKDLGRDRVEVYQSAGRSSPNIVTVANNANASSAPRHDDGAIVDSVRDAIANDRFRMEAQPIVQLGSNAAPRRFELLLRMIDPSGDNIAPDKFMNAAERQRMATDIDRWVVQYALEILSSAAPALEKLGARFAINLSGQSVVDEDFPVFLEDKLREYRLPPNLLSFEIAETAAVANIVRAETLIRRLQDLGHDIALDDFGRGLSSLAYLKSLPVSGLKIDGGLVRDLAGNPRSQAVVTEIVQLARTMNFKTTAKCVESEAILAAASQLGLDYGQGFAIGRPRSLELVLQELLRGAAGVSRSSGSPMMSRLVG